jgi:long-subunit fatty acid transport protein
MGKNSVKILSKTLTLLIFIGAFSKSYGQTQQDVKPKSDFWNHVQFGGGFGIGLGSGYTDVTLAPSAIYNLNDYISIGAGLQGSIVSQKDFYSSAIYGVNVITLFNPVEEVQLSIELEQVRVNNTFRNPTTGTIKDNFWNTGLFVGAGYRMENVTIGMRYNLLFNKDKNVYTDAVMPFIRVYF